MAWLNFLRPAWQHPDPARRRAAIAAQSLEPTLLRELAVGDPDAHVQKAAVDQLVQRHETAILENLARELGLEHATRERVHSYLAAHHAAHWKRGLTSAAKLEILSGLPSLRDLQPYILLVDTTEQAELLERRLKAEPDPHLIQAVLAAPAFPTAIKERLLQGLSQTVLTGLLDTPESQANLGKKWRQRIELLLGKDTAAEKRALEVAEKLTAMHDDLQRALVTPSDDHPRLLRRTWSQAAWVALDPERRHPLAKAFGVALESLEARIAQVEACEKKISDAMEGILAAAAQPGWAESEAAQQEMADVAARVDEWTSQLPKGPARAAKLRLDVLRSELVRSSEVKRAEMREQAVAAARAVAEQQRQRERAERAQRDQERALRDEERMQREREAARGVEQRLDELVARAEELRAEDLDLGKRTELMRVLRGQWQQIQGQAVAPLKQAREARFQAALTASDELSQQAREAEEWRRWAALQKLGQMVTQAEVLVTHEDIAQVAKGLRGLRDQWAELPRQGLSKQDAERARTFQEHWDRAFERVYAAQKHAVEALSALLSGEHPPTPAEVNAIQDAFQELIVPVGARHRDAEEAFRRTIGAYFAQRRQQQAELRQAREVNLEARRQLIAEAERILADQAARDRGARLTELQRRWKAIGPVPREHAETTWAQFRALCQSFFDKQREEQNQVLVVREAICAEMQALIDGLANEPVSAYTQRVPEVEAVAARWSAAVVAPAQREPLESKFRELSAKFYGELQRDRESKREAIKQAAVRKLELVEEAERLADDAASPDRLARVREIESVWAELPGAAKGQEPLLLERLRMAVANAAADGGEPVNVEAAALEKRAICAKLSILYKLWNPSREVPVGFEVSDLGQQLQLALQLKQEVSIPGDPEATRRRILRLVGEALREWKAAGVVAKDARPALLQQFQQLMRGFTE